MKIVQKLIRSDQRSEHSKARCHDSMWLRRYERLSVLVPPQTHAVTDDLNPYGISRITCSQPSLQTRISWLQYL